MDEKLLQVSTITPVLNGAKYIAHNLESIKNQTYRNIEMIVVDNFSTDDTVKIAKNLGATVYLQGPERSSQDNYGVKMAHGKYVHITGCDMVLDPDFIEKCVKKCEEEEYDAIYTSVKSKTTNYWSRVKGLERDAYIGDDFIESARFFRRSVFLDLGGYDSSLVLHADDFDMQKRLNQAGYKTGRIDSYELHIDEIDSIKEVFLKSFYYGMNSLKYIKKYPGHSTKQLMPVRAAFFRNYRMFLKHPFLALGLVVFKLVQYSSATTGLLFALLKLERFSGKFHSKIYKKEK